MVWCVRVWCGVRGCVVIIRIKRGPTAGVVDLDPGSSTAAMTQNNVVDTEEPAGVCYKRRANGP